MKVVILICLTSLVFCLSIKSQDSLSIEEKASEYYKSYFERYNTEGRKYNLKYLDKNGYPPNPDIFSKMFRKKERDSLSTVFLNKTECIPTAMAYMEERLSIWQLMKGGRLPDSTFTVLMDTYYSIAPNEAMASCIRRSNYTKIHHNNIIRHIDYKKLEDYPYVDFLFKNLSNAELLDVLIMCHDTPLAQNKKLMDICYKRIRYDQKDSSKARFEMIKQYVKSKLELENTLSYNEYFVALILGEKDHNN